MSFFRKVWNSVFSRKLGAEIQQEIETHLALLEEEARARGLSRRDAMIEARKRFGSHGKHFENIRDANLSNWLDDLRHDARFTFRQMRKNVGFNIVAALVISLGIGSVTTVFSLVDAVLIRSLPYSHPEGLVYLWTPNRRFGASIPREIAPSVPDFYAWQLANSSFSSLALLNQGMVNLVNGDGAKRVATAFVTGGFFETLGVRPQIGRPIDPSDDQPASGKVVVISDAVWREQFSASRNAIGKVLVLNRQKYTVIGVMPSSFGYPFEGDIPYGTAGFGRTQLWIPLAVNMAQKTDRRNMEMGDAVIGRLRPHVSVEQAQSELTVIERRLVVLYPEGVMRGLQALVTPFVATILGPVSKMLWLLMVAVGLVLIIACGNIANLLLSRLTGRLTEIALRAGLGAGRERIVRQMLTESLMLALLGGVIGVALTFAAVRVLARLNPGNIPRFDQISVNLPVLVLALTISILSGVLFGFAPMIAVLKTNLSDLLKGANRGIAGGSQRLRHGLIVAEVALSFVLLAGAVLLIRSYLKLQAQDTGFSGSTLTMNLALDGRYNKPEQRSALFMRFLETLRHLPGVVSAGAGSDLPLDHSESIGQVEVKGFGTSKDMIDSWWVTPRYFRALGMDLRAGRLFDDHDMKNVATSIIVNQAFVNAYMHGRDPLTCQVRYGYETDMAGRPWATVVGVVGNMKHSTLEEKPRPEYLQPYRPNFDAWNLHFAVKSRLAPQIILPFIRQGLRHLDPALGLDDVRTMQERIAEANARRSFQTAVLTTFAGMALLLAMIGVYGVMAYSVRQRTPEIGIRMALGASARQVSLMVARQGLSLVAAGLIIGTGIALVLARTITAWLYGVGPHDPLTFVLLPLPVLAAAGCACVIPALNASRVDPAIAIRNE